VSRRVTPTTPLSERQLARMATAPVSTYAYVLDQIDRNANRVLITYLVAIALGDVLSPEGTVRPLRRGERGSEGVLLTTAKRHQLALLEAAWAHPVYELEPRLLPDAERKLAMRRHEKRVRALAEIGLVHRCIPHGPATFYLHPHEPGDICEWAQCPSGKYAPPARVKASQRDAQSVPVGRIKRRATTHSSRDARSSAKQNGEVKQEPSTKGKKDEEEPSVERGTEGSTAIGAIGESTKGEPR
jgi:hypothetical protein